ncbi:MAG: hypothetical protein KBT28_08525 [Bacteroidales bacterium]|nr:hypothetical protein [Candidatus Colimorpha merdihippi]
MELDEQKYRVNLKTLHILLTLSFINTGMYLLSGLISTTMLPSMSQYYNANSSLFPDEFGILLERALNIPQWYYLLGVVLDAASIVGLILMWRLRKNGFHCYTLSKLLLIMLPVLFLDRSYVGVGNIMIAVLFIAYYFFLMKSLNTFDENGSTQILSSDNDNSSESSSSEQ